MQNDLMTEAHAIIHAEMVNHRSNYIGEPQASLLNQWGHSIYVAFQEVPYLVGSATQHRYYRDVDVRLMLPDDRYDFLFGTTGISAAKDMMQIGMSLYAQKVTGLPIDFQFQRRSDANKCYSQKTGTVRCALGLYHPTNCGWAEKPLPDDDDEED